MQADQTTFPDTLPAVLRPILPALCDEIVNAVAHEVDAYRKPLDGPFGTMVRSGVEQSLGRFLDSIAGEPATPRDTRPVSIALGRGEFEAGRSLDALQSAFRIGAGIAWRRVAERGVETGVQPELLYALAQSIFEYIDELSAEAVEGYAEAQSEAAGERHRARERLLALLRRQPAPDEAAVQATAREAGWILTPTLAALLVDDVRADVVAARLGSQALAVADEGTTLVLLGDPGAPNRRAALARTLRDSVAVLGPAVAWTDVPHSIERAGLARRLRAEGVLPAAGLLATDDHLPALMLHADPRLAHDLAAHVLAPLDELRPSARERLTETLAAWLDHQGRIDQTAYALGVHVQTVRYRLTLLRVLLGPALEDADRRFALAVALRAGGGAR